MGRGVLWHRDEKDQRPTATSLSSPTGEAKVLP